MNSHTTAILTRAEIEWLNGLKDVSKTHEYKMKSVIRKKLDTLANTELPLIEKSGFFYNDLTKFGKKLTDYSKVEKSIVSNFINCAQKRSLGRDLDPGPLPYQGNALPG